MVSAALTVIYSFYLHYAWYEQTPDPETPFQELSVDIAMRTASNAALLVPFTWRQPSFWAQVGFSVITLIAKDYLGIEYKIKNALWPVVIILCLAKAIMGARAQYENDVASMLAELKYNTKLINLI